MIPFDVHFRVIKGGELDAWGESVPLDILEVKGNLRSQTKLTKNDRGEEVISTYQLLFRGCVNIQPQDKVQFTEGDGRMREMYPITIKWMRHFSGEIGFTKVEL